MILEYLLMVSQPNLSALEQSWLHDSQLCVVSQVYSHKFVRKSDLRT